jgi:hypothetical protein
LALSAVGPTDVRVRDACEPIPPTNAELIISIDDEVESYGIYLPHGIPNAPQTVSYSPATS